MIDFSLNENKLIQNSDIDLILQQIDILFDTNPKEVLGQELYGSQYDKYLYKLKLSNENIKQKVLSDLYSLELFGFTPSVDVIFLEGSERDIALIKIDLYRNQESYEQIYKIE